MRSRGLVIVLVVASLSLAGCVTFEQPAGDDSVTRQQAPAVLDEAGFTFGLADGGETDLVWEMPAEAGGLFGMVNVRLAPGTEFTLTAHAPDGAEQPVASASASPLAELERSDWFVLPAQAGEWTFRATVEGDGEAEGALNLTAAPDAQLERVRGSGPDDRVVVAVVDTGVNPYHEVFQRPNLTTDALPPRIVDEAGEGPVRVPLHRDADLTSSIARDAGAWADLPSQELVHFEGTNVLGYHLDEHTLPNLPVLDRAGHGTAVANSVVRENPDALVVMITGPDYDDGVAWAAAQPWIDLISLSWGPAANAAGPAFEAIGFFRTMDETRVAHEAGQVVFTATGNDPTPAITDTTSGPPWVHAVSGSLPDDGGRATLSGNFVDTVANWTQDLARHDSLEETRTISGTSFATPTTAGIASRILHEARVQAGHEGGIVDGALVNAGGVTITGKDLRDALNATAVYWDTADYEPGSTGAVPVAPAPWVSQGWGHLDGSVVPAAVGGLLGGSLPDKPAEAEAWMTAHLEARKAYWNR